MARAVTIALATRSPWPPQHLMPHTSNIKAFLRATLDQAPLVRAYCGLVAIELVLKQEVGLTDHNICAGLDKFRVQRAVGTKSWTATALIALTNRIRSGIVAIHVNDKLGLPRSAPFDSYPYIRYLRLEGDGWGAPETALSTVEALAAAVLEVRVFLRTHFELPL